MKILFLIIFLFSSNLFAQLHSIRLINEDGTSTEYDLKQIDSINLNSIYNLNKMNVYKVNSSTEINLESNAQITFQDNLINIKTNSNAFVFNTNEIDSMTIKSTAKAQNINIKELVLDKVILNTSFSNPWAIAFLNNDEMLVTEKSGSLYRINVKTASSTPITGVPKVNAGGQGGLLDIQLHPDFESNHLVYLCYTVSGTGGQVLAMGRGTLEGNQLLNFKELFKVDQPISGQNNQGSRMVFDWNKYLYLSVGDRFTPNFAQDTNSYLGKILRFNEDGTIPKDNPFYGIANKKWEIWSLGHRNIQGLAINPNTGELWAHEHGPKGGDELNHIKKGANYGWPKATFGVNYDGSIISNDTTLPGYEDPKMYWKPSIAPCGLTFLKYPYPTVEQDILMGALAGQQIVRIKIKDNKVVQNIINMKNYARFRDVKQAADGTIYAIMEGPSRIISLKEK